MVASRPRPSPALLAAALAALWLVLAPRTPDLAAQVYRSTLFARTGFSVWDGSWFAGHHLPGYSLLFPPLGALLGPRVVGALAAVASTLLFDRLARTHFGARARAGTVWFAVASMGDLVIGRLTFSLGVAFGLAALTALADGRRRLAVLLAVVTAAASPVAGAFLALAGVALALGTPRRAGLAVAAAALGLVLALGVLFPEGGTQPFTTPDMLEVVGATVLLLAWLPRTERALRAGAALYALSALAAYAVATPMGSNVGRLGATFAGPLLACVAWRSPTRRVAFALAATALLAWQWWAPAHQISISIDDPSTSAAYYRPVTQELDRLGGPIGRVEVPFTRGHWETVYLAAHFALARGWETQLDTRYDGLFYDHDEPLAERTYHAWLRAEGVRWVALPDAPFGPPGATEAALVRHGLPFLHPVWHSAHWVLYRVTDPGPMVEPAPAPGVLGGAGTLARLGPGSFTVRVTRPGRMLVRVRDTPYWSPVRGAGCVAALGPWTAVTAAATGDIRVSASFDPLQALDPDAACRGVRSR